MNKKLLSLKKDGNMWCVLWGENLQEGIAGFGDTVETAMRNFINEYNTKEKGEPMTLEEKFKKHVEKLQNNHFTVAIPKLIHDFVLIAQEGQEVIAELKSTGKLLDLAARMDSLNKEIYYHLDRGHKVKIILEVQE